MIYKLSLRFILAHIKKRGCNKMSFLAHFVAVFFPITNTIAGIFHFREKCQLSVFRRTLISLAVFSFFSKLLYVFLLFSIL